MAIILDKKNDGFNEKNSKVLNAIKNNLPDNYSCYCNCDVEGYALNYCLSIENKGLFIIEERDWKIENIIDVTASGDVKLQDSNGEVSTVGSPGWIVKSVQFALTNVLRDKYGINPPIYIAVCYSNLTLNEYKEKGLEYVSEPGVSIFKEDIECSESFVHKIESIIEEHYIGYIFKYDYKTEKICIKYLQGEDITDDSYNENPYSLLKICKSELDSSEIKTIVDQYFSGTKVILFTGNINDLTRLTRELTDRLNSQGKEAAKGNIILKSKAINEIKITDGHFSIFNFEAFYSERFDFTSDYTIVNGTVYDKERSVLNSIREKVYFNLQQYYVEHAPLGKDICVKAGAGTGKTYSMVSRIAFLTLNKKLSGVYKIDEDIAMLTFTKKAAGNMKTRLKKLFMNYYSLTGKTEYLECISSVEKMQISTIHSFARKIIEKTSIPLGIGTEFKTSSGIYERRGIFNRNFNEFLKKKSSDNPFFVFQLPISVDVLQKKFLQLSEILYNKGVDIKTLTANSFGDDIEGIPYTRELIEDVLIKSEKEYSEKLIENNCIRLNEYMIYLKKIVTSASFNSNFFGFKYLFVDEFQDTDEAQISAFLDMQRKLSFCFFIVGDLKQSIYRFRGSSMDAFKKMGCDKGNWLNYSLFMNYRTDRQVLEIFDRSFVKWGACKISKDRSLLPFINGEDNLVGVKYNSDNKDPVIRIEYNSNNDDVEELTINVLKSEIEKLQERIKKGKLSENERTIAVLVRTNDDVRDFTNIVKKYDIAVETDSVGDLYRIQPTIDLCKLTSALCNPYNTTYLFDLINSNYVKAKFEDFQFIKEKTDDEKRDIFINYLDTFLSERLNRTWEQLISEIQSRPVLMMLRLIFEKLQPWIKYSAEDSDRLFYRSNYNLVFEQLSDENNESYLTLESINETLHINIETGTEEESKSAITEEADIKIICQTVHKSKGLEFGTVIMPYMERRLGKISGNAVYVSVDNNEKVGYMITYDGEEYLNEYFDVDSEINEITMEEVRILYVAMTRAINRFVYITEDKNNKNTWGGLIEL